MLKNTQRQEMNINCSVLFMVLMHLNQLLSIIGNTMTLYWRMNHQNISLFLSSDYLMQVVTPV